MPQNTPGHRILLVEDEVMISMLIEDMVLDLGHAVIGPAVKIDDAMFLARRADFDLAVLDISIGGTAVYPIADILRSRGIPFIFVTGYDKKALPPRFEGSRILSKPFSDQSFGDTLGEIFAASPTAC
ncbi:response regulator [Microvirga sp. GCM10011540]|uniref:response regulator n=1 Tax=Microvirga sp. GCM10011540 TaxID=3317338 RepID=UPI00361A3264